MIPLFTLTPQKIINCLYNICRPFRALTVVGFTRPVGAGYNLTALAGREENIVSC
jgi:hypothetical protein